jgi:penicillin amidase
VEGSNEWAVSGALTADGRPLMANDPHLSLDVPATFHQVHLRSLAAGMDVMGSGFPGTPYVILGQNRRITWGATTNPMDVTDTYQEQIVVDPASPSGLATVHQGANEPVIPIPETFRFNVLDGAPDTLVTAGDAEGVPPVTLIVPRRNQGPIVALDVAAGTALSVQYTGFSATREIDAFRLWNQARNLGEFEAGLRFFDFGSQNWAYADVDGNIAYFTSAEMPLREDLAALTVDGLPPFFIRDGTGGNEWLPAGPDRPEHHAIPYQVLPTDEMPHVVNPPAGWFVNANNDPAGTTLDNDPLNQLSPTSGIYYLNPGYAQGTRAGRITDRIRALAARGDVTAEDMMALQADVVMLDAQVLVPYILDAASLLVIPTPEVAEALARLGSWDFSAPTGIAQGYDAADVDGVRLPPGQDEIDASIAATIYSLWRSRMIANTLDATIAPFGLPRPGSDRSIIALRHLLDTFEDDHGVGASGLDFFALGAGATPEARRDDVILTSLEEALDLLAGPDFAAAFGGSTDQDDYRWGLLHRIVFDHPLGPPFSIPPAGGGFVPTLPPDLEGVPVDGGFGVVDASSHSARADSVDEFRFGSGPVRRYVGSPGHQPGSIEAWTAMPGGPSGVLGHPWYFNLLPRWLTNDAYPVLHRFEQVQQDAFLRFIYRPAGG